MRSIAPIALLSVAALLLAGCSGTTDTTDDGSGNGSGGEPTNGGNGPSNPYDAPNSRTSVFGSGSTFAKPILDAWSIQYGRIDPNVQVSYAGGGSGKGISDITKKDTTFGASDAPLSPSEKAAAPGILQFPLTLGPIAVVYNVAGVADGLKLDGETIGKIYTGEIRKWNDEAIELQNPGVTLPDVAIAIVYRSDSSGTTFAFTDFLTRASPAWVAKMGSAPSKKPDWTKSNVPANSQLSGNGNDGVGSTVKNTPNTIGYVELSYVKALGLKDAQVKNKDGNYLDPSTAGATAAAASLSSLPDPSGDWSAVSIAYAEGAQAYPISTFAYAMVYDSVSAYGGKASADQIQAFKAWMWWSLHDGQEFAEALGYAPLPANVVAAGDSALAAIH